MLGFLKRLGGQPRGDAPANPASTSLFRQMVDGRPVFVLGSAPGASLDERGPDDVLVTCNGSIIPFPDTVPDVLVINAYTTSMENAVGKATMTGLAGRHVRHVVFLVTKSTLEDMATNLRAQGISWETEEVVTKSQRIAMTRTLLVEDFTGDAVSTGVTAIMLAQAGGAASIRLSGFSFFGGHSYIADRTRRAHASIDRLVLDRLGLTLQDVPDQIGAPNLAPAQRTLVVLATRLAPPKENAEPWLAARLRFFETVTLPFIRDEAAIDPDIRLCVLADPKLPETWIERLRDLAQDVPQVDIVTRINLIRLREGVRTYAIAQMQPAHDLLCTIRLDADVCLHAGCIAGIRTLCRAKNAGAIISHPHGLYLARSGDGTLLVRKRYDVNNTAGIAYLSDRAGLSTIFDAGPAATYHDRFPMVISDVSNAWIRVLDASPAERVYARQGWMPAARLQAEIASRFPHLDTGAGHLFCL